MRALEIKQQLRDVLLFSEPVSGTGAPRPASPECKQSQTSSVLQQGLINVSNWLTSNNSGLERNLLKSFPSFNGLKQAKLLSRLRGKRLNTGRQRRLSGGLPELLLPPPHLGRSLGSTQHPAQPCPCSSLLKDKGKAEAGSESLPSAPSYG